MLWKSFVWIAFQISLELSIISYQCKILGSYENKKKIRYPMELLDKLLQSSDLALVQLIALHQTQSANAMKTL